MSDSAIIAIITAVAGVVAGFFKLIDNQNKLHEKLAISIDSMADASRLVATATQETAAQAESRNGHLADITIQQGDRIVEMVAQLKEQHVETQVIEHQEIK